MIGHHFKKFDPNDGAKSRFEQLLDMFMQLLTYTNGELSEALSWMNELDKKFELTDDEYGIGDFIEDLKDKGYITEDNQLGEIKITPKTEQGIRKRSLEEIFGKLKKTKQGDHHSFKPGQGDELNPESRPFRFGDMIEQIDFTESIRNAQINHGIESFNMQEDDLSIRETDFKAQTSTVLMIDISHSMILYGEDRITPAKKVAMALSELITTRYPKDTLVNTTWLPTIQAALEINRGNTEQAIQLLQAARQFELEWLGRAWPVYVRGLAYLRGGAGAEAMAEFQKIIDHRGLVPIYASYPLAQLGLARAAALTGDTAKSRKAYEDFFALWKDADPDIPILIEAKKQYDKLR